MPAKRVLYECDICSSLHPWGWDGDCRDDKHRFVSVQDYVDREGEPHQVGMSRLTAEDIEVRPMCDRIAKDEGKEACPWHPGGTT